MKSFATLFILLFVAIQVDAQDKGTDWGIVKVGSTYVDESSLKKEVLEVGTGSLVQLAENRFIVLTAAHVIRGKSPWVELNGQKRFVSSEMVLFDADHDVAIFEVDGPHGLHPVFSVDPKSYRMIPNSELDLDPVKYRSRTLSDHVKVVKLDSRISFSNDPKITEPTRTQSFWVFDAVWAPKIPVVPRGDWNAEDRSREDPMYVTLGNQIRVHFTARPGLSGTSSIKKVNSLAEFAGVLVQYNSFFKDAYFASAKVVEPLTRSFLEGKRGANSSTDWFMRNGLTFRRYAEGYEEALFVNRPSGNGINADSGNGVYVDPGNGVYVDPGNGVYVDPGSHKDSPGASSPQEVMQKYGLGAGMLFNGKSVIGIRAVPLLKGRSQFTLYANPQAIVFMRKYRESYAFYPVLQGDDLIDCLRDLVHMWFPKFRGRSAFELYAIEAFGSTGRYSPTDGTLVASEDTISVHAETLSFVFKDYLQPETPKKGFNFTLDRKGRLPGQERFSPIVDATDSRTGQQFRVDLRGLFFVDLSNLITRNVYRENPKLKSDIEMIESKNWLAVPLRIPGKRFEIEQLFWSK